MPHVGHHDTTEDRQTERRKQTAILKMARRGQPDTQATLHDMHLAEQVDNDESNDNSMPVDARDDEIRTGNREELMERIKRGERPTWMPSANLRALCKEEEVIRSQIHELSEGSKIVDHVVAGKSIVDDPFFGPWTESRPAAQQARSPLHRGDFNGTDEAQPQAGLGGNLVASPIDSVQSSPPPWLLTSYPSSMACALGDSQAFTETPRSGAGRTRAPSLGSSLSSSFVLRTPTSPLAHAVRTNDMDNTTKNSNVANTGTKFRRRTMPPNSLHTLQVSPIEALPPNFSRPFSNTGSEGSQPHSMHRSRRSLSSFTYQPTSSPSSHSRLRRLSLASDASPRQLTSMVGSFEESILHGRMSSPASQPIDFVAQIGVVGKGDCSSSLRCPAHVSVPFQAVFYRYPSSTQIRSVSDDTPSPYVGTVDLENNLKPILLSAKRKRASSDEPIHIAMIADPRAPENTPIGKALARDAEKRKQRSTSPKMTLGGAYRVPQKGQLQIIIKNQNKTAVKLFLVPYDLEGMQAGTKTFIRQKSYSKGSMLDNIRDTTTGMSCVHDTLKDKQILRYLIHIRFCCPTKGKYYLHDHIRVVFANRVPEGKEKLENEIQLPDPKYSVFRLRQQSRRSSQISAGDSLIVEEQYGVSPVLPGSGMLSHSPTDTSQYSNPPITIPGWNSSRSENQSSVGISHQPVIDTVGEHNSQKFAHETFSFARDGFQRGPVITPEPSISPKSAQALSPVQGFRPSTSARSSPVSWANLNTTLVTRSFSPAPVEAGDGLLSQQFKHLYGSNTSNTFANKISNDQSEVFAFSPKDTQDIHGHSYSQTERQTKAEEEHSEQGDISLHPMG